MDLQTNQVLVTGAAGWLGTGLLQALTQGLPDVAALRDPPKVKIRAMVLPDQDLTAIKQMSDQVEIVTGDLRNPQDCERFCKGASGAMLFHTAGIIHPRRVSDFYRINVEGTASLISAAVKGGVKRAIVVSSNSPCGVNPHPDHLFDENSPYHPYMNYGRSKMLMERNVASANSSGSIETVIIRAPWFYGPHQPPRQTLFFTMIRDGKMPIVGGGGALRSMAYIDNLCQGLLLAAMTPAASGKIYWIADARPYSMNEIVDTVERLLETEFGQTCAHRRVRLPGFASEVAWLVDKLLQSINLYHQKFHVLSEMNKTIACSIAQAQRELGYDPKISLEEGMRRSLRWLVDKSGGHGKFTWT